MNNDYLKKELKNGLDFSIMKIDLEKMYFHLNALEENFGNYKRSFMIKELSITCDYLVEMIEALNVILMPEVFDLDLKPEDEDANVCPECREKSIDDELNELFPPMKK